MSDLSIFEHFAGLVSILLEFVFVMTAMVYTLGSP
mgnify:CR=1 FL=1